MIREQNMQVADAPNMAYDAVLTAGNFKPILFSTPMVQAILRGEKTQTRRLVKEDKLIFENFYIENNTKFQHIKGNTWKMIPGIGAMTPTFNCKYKIGDILWVRETWHPKRHNFPIGWKYEYKATAKEDGNPTDEPWKPSIFMPKDACRIFLKITNIRIERLNDISENDAIAEGIEREIFKIDSIPTMCYKIYGSKKSWDENAINSYWSLWDYINGKESWFKNPLIWVYEFERTDASFACS